MKDFVSKGKEKSQAAHSPVIRRFRLAHDRKHNSRLHPIRSRDKTEKGHLTEVFDGSLSSEGGSPSSDAESSEGYTLVQNGTLIVFDNGPNPNTGPRTVPADIDKHPSLLGPLGAGRVDPFDTYPTHFKNNLVTSQLLDHCNHPFPFAYLSFLVHLESSLWAFEASC